MGKIGESRHEAIEHEILGEKAAALGRGGRRVEAVLAALGNAAGEEREAVLDEAARTVWGFLVQRELLGLRDRERVIAHYAIPTEVLNRMGAIKP